VEIMMNREKSRTTLFLSAMKNRLELITVKECKAKAYKGQDGQIKPLGIEDVRILSKVRNKVRTQISGRKKKA